MADRYLSFTGTASGRFLTRRLGLPQPAALRRWSPGAPGLDGGLLHLTAGTSGLDLAPVLARTGLGTDDATGRPAAVVLDAAGIRDVEGLAEVHAALHPVVRSVAASGRIVVLGAPLDPADHHQAAAQQALEGFVRSLGKEIGRGRTVNLVRLTDAPAAESTLRFLLSPRSAYVSGQVIEVGAHQPVAPDDGDRPLAGRTALVTGAARGIGAATAVRLAAEGRAVAVIDLDEAACKDTVEKITAAGGRAVAVGCDVSDEAQVEAAVARIAEELGAPTILVNNAGVLRDNLLFKMSVSDWDTVMNVHLRGAFLMSRACQKHMVDAGFGRIVNLSSSSALGNRGQINYSAAKAGLQGFTKTLAKELGKFGVTANAVAPGFIATEMTKATAERVGMGFEDFKAAAATQIPVNRVGEPEDVADAIAFFTGEAAGFVSGQVLYVAGGPLD